jgi:peptide-methionine (S)-S-oxide reductase
VGYAGGTTANPTYHDLGGAAETVQFDFDPAQVSYEQLVEMFFSFHDATFAPPSSQYRSVIFVNGPEQERIAREVLQRVQAGSKYPIMTQIVLAGSDGFHLAEDYHQKYALQTDMLLFKELSAIYPGLWDLVDSPAATRINAYLDGYGTNEQLRAELDSLGLSAAGKEHLLSASPAVVCPLK